MNSKQTLPGLAVSLFAVAAHNQSCSIDWHTIDGGGGPIAGGIFKVISTTLHFGEKILISTNFHQREGVVPPKRYGSVAKQGAPDLKIVYE